MQSINIGGTESSDLWRNAGYGAKT